MNWIQDSSGISEADLNNVFRYEEKKTTLITWLNDDTPLVQELDGTGWERWLRNADEHPDWQSSEPGVFMIIAQPGQECPSNHIEEEFLTPAGQGGQRNLRTVPFSKTIFRQITEKFYTHASISAAISRADVPVFSSTQVYMKGADCETHLAYVYNCRTSNEWAKDLALTVTHLPQLQKTFCIIFGCDDFTKAVVKKRLLAAGTDIYHPLIMPAILAELERTRHKEITGDAVSSMETKIAELDFIALEADEESGSGVPRDRNSARRTTWLDTAHLRNGLINWKFQLEKFRQCVATFSEVGETKVPQTIMLQPNGSDDTTFGLDSVQVVSLTNMGKKMAARLEAIEEEYDQMIRDCAMRLEGMTMATQWAQGETNLAIAKATSRDSKHMRFIALITMLFLPGTFLAGVFSMNFFNWHTPDNSMVSSHFWIYIVFTAFFTLLTVGSWWYFAIHRRKTRSS